MLYNVDTSLGEHCVKNVNIVKIGGQLPEFWVMKRNIISHNNAII